MLNPLSFISKIFKSSNDIELAKFRKILEKINSLENDVTKIKDSDFFQLVEENEIRLIKDKKYVVFKYNSGQIDKFALRIIYQLFL